MSRKYQRFVDPKASLNSLLPQHSNRRKLQACVVSTTFAPPKTLKQYVFIHTNLPSHTHRLTDREPLKASDIRPQPISLLLQGVSRGDPPWWELLDGRCRYSPADAHTFHAAEPRLRAESVLREAGVAFCRSDCCCCV